MNSEKVFIGQAGGAIPLQGGKDTIATVILHGDESAFNQGEQTANAKLIAAAPRMLEALEAAHACLAHLHQLQQWDKREGDEYDEATDAENACLNAITQAKGGA